MSLPVLVPCKGQLVIEAIKLSDGTEGFRMIRYGLNEDNRRVIKDLAEAREDWVLVMWADEKNYTHLPVYHSNLQNLVSDTRDALGFGEYVEIACSLARNESKK